MTEFSPPLGGVRPSGDQTCGRLAAGSYCGRPAVAHVMWTADGENGLCCDEHMAEARAAWVFVDVHPVTGLCATNDAGVMWLWSWVAPPGWCAVSGDQPGAFLVERPPASEDVPA